MTVSFSSRRAKPRWLILCLVVFGLSAIGVGLTAGHGATTLPAGYVGSTLEDVHGANDVPGQVDVTMMGRDNTQSPKMRIFWSWDSISAWTGTGQTGDACALFDDNDADVFIDYVVCARVQNLNADPNNVVIQPAAANKPVYIFDCSNKKDDRCTNPVPRAYTAGQVLAGPLATLSQSGAGNLISELDPFNAADLNGPGESHPHDSTIDIEIAAALVPANVSLANVCSYPSAGNGGNNNPFDCIVTPGTQYGTLRVVKVLTNNSGGTKAVGDFSFDVSGSVANDVAFDATDNTNEFIVPIGPYTVTENAAAGYATTYGNSTNANTNCNSIVVSVGATTICTITNNDIAGSLQLVKRVRNDDGGTATVTPFGLSTSAGSLTFDTGAADGANVTKYTSNVIAVSAGSYTFSESDVAGYAEGTWACTGATASGTAFGSGAVTVPLDTAVVCTITNNDDAGSLQLVKKVTNNDGGTKTVADFSIGTSAGPLTFGNGTVDGSTTTYTAGAITVGAGAYTLTEANVAGYAEGGWSCPLGTNVTSTFSGGSVTVPNGVAVVCEITNNDDAGSLQIVKKVTNDNGGTKTVADFGIGTSAGTLTFGNGTVNGSTTTYTAVAITVAAGSYTFSESDVTGYSEGTWDCTGASASGTAYNAGSVTVPNGGTVVCTITNNDDAGTLQLVKRVTNDNGGTATVTTFGIGTSAGSPTFGTGAADGPNTIKYTSNAISVGAGTYTLTESDVAGYTEGSWNCPLGTNVTSTFSAGSVTVPNGAAVVCTITNDDAKASPTGATTQSYVLYDSLAITGLRTGAPDASSATVSFKLFSSDTCSAGSQVGSTVTVTGVTTSTIAIPAGSGIAVSTAGTYYWLVTYSGDQFNNPITKSCGQEQTTISKIE